CGPQHLALAGNGKQGAGSRYTSRFALSASRFSPAQHLITLEKGEYLCCVLLRFLERWPMAAVVEEHQARVSDVVEDGDAYLKGDHAVIPPMDEEHGRLNAGERWCVVVRHAHRLSACLFKRRRPGMRLVDIVHQLIGDQRFIVNMHTQVPADV